MVDPEYILDFDKMVQTHVFDPKRRRAVKRGNQGQRSVRPSDERFADNKNFLVGQQFRPITELKYDGEDITCHWLGDEFHETIKRKLFSAKTVLDGVKEHHKQEQLKQFWHKKEQFLKNMP